MALRHYVLFGELLTISACYWGPCHHQTYPNQCVDRVRAWAAFNGADAGTPPPRCPTVEELRSSASSDPSALGLLGWGYVDGPRADPATDRCCYTTEDPPCD